MSTALDLNWTTMQAGLRSGDRYRHWKGGAYSVLTCAHEEATGFVVVVYKSETTGKIWTRPLGDFMGLVKQPDGPSVPRFVLIEPEEKARS